MPKRIRKPPSPTAIVTKAQRDLARVNEAVANQLVEDVFVSVMHKDKRSVRAVQEGKDVVLYSTDESALREVHDALVSGEGKLFGKVIKPPSREDLARMLGDGKK